MFPVFPRPQGVGSSLVMDTVEQLIDSSISQSTNRLYSKTWDIFSQFCGSCSPKASPLPAQVPTLAAFFSLQFASGKVGSTLTTYSSPIAFVHKINGFSDPTDSFIIRKMLKGARSLTSSPDTRLPISFAMLNNLCSALPHVIRHWYNTLLYQSMFLFAFYAFCRVGEITLSSSPSYHTVCISDIQFNKDLTMTVHFKHFKHSEGKSVDIIIHPATKSFCPVRILSRYISYRGHNPGPLFIFSNGIPVSTSNFSSTLAKVLQFLDLPTSVYKSHSFRIGAATHAAIRGFSDQQIRIMGRWKSNAFLKYIRISSF